MEKAPSDLGYVITGLGRSGTTLLAHVFLNAGYDLGNVKPQHIGKNAPAGGGLEYVPFAKANMRLQSEVSHLWSAAIDESHTPQDYKRLGKRFTDLLNQQWPFVVKDPRFCDTARIWHAAGKIPRHVFLCMRNPLHRNKSVAALVEKVSGNHLDHILMTHRSYYTYFSVFNLILLCQEEDIPLSIVLYPRIGQDRAYAERVLGPFIRDPWAVVQQTWSEKELHHTPIPVSEHAASGASFPGST